MEKGLDINAIDSRNSTPLHWACYSKSEVALNYLISWGANLDAQDADGLSPLHLAVKSVEGLKSTRPVRALLIKGAKRDIADQQSRRAIDLL